MVLGMLFYMHDGHCVVLLGMLFYCYLQTIGFSDCKHPNSVICIMHSEEVLGLHS